MPALRAAVWSALAAAGLATEPRRHLLVDPDVVAATVGRTKVALGPVHKSPANPLLAEDRKWEASWKNTNPSVVYKDGVYHLWMTTNVVRPPSDTPHPGGPGPHPPWTGGRPLLCAGLPRRRAGRVPLVRAPRLQLHGPRHRQARRGPALRPLHRRVRPPPNPTTRHPAGLTTWGVSVRVTKHCSGFLL